MEDEGARDTEEDLELKPLHSLKTSEAWGDSVGVAMISSMGTSTPSSFGVPDGAKGGVGVRLSQRASRLILEGPAAGRGAKTLWAPLLSHMGLFR